MTQSTEYPLHPAWWTEQYNSTWDRVKEAFRRDWEQTKADLSLDTGRELHQTASDTVLQALGREPLPLPHQPNPSPVSSVVENDRNWSAVEPAVRYGYGAGSHYSEHQAWNGELEARLSQEWHGLNHETAWESIKHAVRHGWDTARGKG